MYDMISKKKFEAHVKTLQVPEGFTASWEKEVHGWGKGAETVHVFVVKSDTIELRFDQTGCGHTNFDMREDQYGRQFWSTLDRRGVEDSFYHLPLYKGDKTKYNLNKILVEQLERVAECLAARTTAISVPGIPFTVQPERLVRLKQELSKGRSISFMPSGFGTGYNISPKPQHGAKRASAEMQKFFGVAPLFISTFDAD